MRDGEILHTQCRVYSASHIDIQQLTQFGDTKIRLGPSPAVIDPIFFSQQLYNLVEVRDLGSGRMGTIGVPDLALTNRPEGKTCSSPGRQDSGASSISGRVRK